MKPHIYKADGVWICKKIDTFAGFGDTPEEAYLEWEEFNAYV